LGVKVAAMPVETAVASPASSAELPGRFKFAPAVREVSVMLLQVVTTVVGLQESAAPRQVQEAEPQTSAPATT
jgi:hypothetical protein